MAISLNGIFKDKMVFQWGAELRVFGYSDKTCVIRSVLIKDGEQVASEICGTEQGKRRIIAENFVVRVNSGTLNFCLLYLIGRWISRTSLLQKIKFNPLYAYLIVSVIITGIVLFLHVKLHLNATQMQSFILGYSYSSPLVILQAVFLFLLFGKLNIQNRAINWCAASCLSIFLIHMHPTIKEIGYYSFTRSLYQQSFLEHLLILCALIIAVFIGSILVDKIRMVVSFLCEKTLTKAIRVAEPLKAWFMKKIEVE